MSPYTQDAFVDGMAEEFQAIEHSLAHRVLHEVKPGAVPCKDECHFCCETGLQDDTVEHHYTCPICNGYGYIVRHPADQTCLKCS